MYIYIVHRWRLVLPRLSFTQLYQSSLPRYLTFISNSLKLHSKVNIFFTVYIPLIFLKMCYMTLLFVFSTVSEPPLMTDKTVTDCIIYGCTKAETEEEDVKPKYKYFEDMKDPRRERDIVIKLRQSPGMRRRKEKEKHKAERESKEQAKHLVKLKSDEIVTESRA